jgi:hypothetical protein
MGLKVDTDRTEVMFFTPHLSHNHGECPIMITISVGDSKTLIVKLSTSLHYLGVYFMPKLDWKLHVTTMANRTRSMVKALGLLRSSM